MNTISDIKSAFYDAQRQAANMIETLVAEVVALNAKVKELEEAAPKVEKKKV